MKLSISIRVSLVIAVLCSSLCNAEVIRNQHGGYSFVFPPGWTLDRAQKDFTVFGPNKVELSEMPLPQPPADMSLELATQTAVAAWLAAGGGNSTDKAFDLSGKKWKGRAVVVNMDSRSTKGTTQVVLFVAKSNKYFRHFTLSIPAEEWKNNSQQYLGILGTMRLPDSGQR